jgi:gluconokinase
MAGHAGATLVIGVDIGTTSVKAVSYDVQGRGHDAFEIEYPLDTSQPDRAVQDPDHLVASVLEALRRVVSAAAAHDAPIAGVSFSSVMHGLLALDRHGRPLTPLLTFADTRAAEQADRVRRDLGGLEIYRRTGTPIHPMSPLVKLLWFREHDRDVFDAAACWLSIKEYLFLRLFGETITDHSVASATGLFNLASLDWDPGALALVGLSADQLPRPVPTTHVCRGLSGEHAAQLGLDRNTPFVMGASDGVLANLGVGAINPDVVACSIGTSGAARVTLREPRTDPEGRVFCYALTDDRWVVGGAISNGGIVLRWLRDELFPEIAERARVLGREPYELLVELAEAVPAGAGGLILLPYLTGERAPHWSSLPRGVLFGLRRQHRQAHVVRAALEGVMFQLHWVVRLIENFGIEPTEFRATGGFASSPLWRQIMADVFARPITVPQHVEGSAFGAALLGMWSLGLVGSLEVANDRLRIAHVEQPIAEHVEVYAQLQRLFERIYGSLRSDFAAIAELQAALPMERSTTT